MGRIIEVEYSQPVIVEVDVEEGTIVRVIEAVEEMKQTGRISAPDEGTISAGETMRAFHIAEEQDWPARDRGY